MSTTTATKISALDIGLGSTISFGTNGGAGTVESPIFPLLASGWTKRNMVTITVASLEGVEHTAKGFRALLVTGTDGLVYHIPTGVKVRLG